jgi:hypothetical protein
MKCQFAWFPLAKATYTDTRTKDTIMGWHTAVYVLYSDFINHHIPGARWCWFDARRFCEPWLAWVSMERSLRQLGPARALFKRAYSRKFEEGGQVALAYEWLKFEREEGRCEGC